MIILFIFQNLSPYFIKYFTRMPLTSPPSLQVLDPYPSCRVPATRHLKRRPPRIAFHPTRTTSPFQADLKKIAITVSISKFIDTRENDQLCKYLQTIVIAVSSGILLSGWKECIPSKRYVLAVSGLGKAVVGIKLPPWYRNPVLRDDLLDQTLPERCLPCRGN